MRNVGFQFGRRQLPKSSTQQGANNCYAFGNVDLNYLGCALYIRVELRRNFGPKRLVCPIGTARKVLSQVARCLAKWVACRKALVPQQSKMFLPKDVGRRAHQPT